MHDKLTDFDSMPFLPHRHVYGVFVCIFAGILTSLFVSNQQQPCRCFSMPFQFFSLLIIFLKIFCRDKLRKKLENYVKIC